MMELFELVGMAATLVAAYQGNLLQALLNGYATPTMYAEELGLDPISGTAGADPSIANYLFYAQPTTMITTTYLPGALAS